MRHLLAALLLLMATALPVLAIQPDEMLPDAGMEARARVIGKDLRCLVCQNQSIDDSDAELARDLRTLVRQRLLVGDSDAQAKQYIVDRYGDYVLLKPPFRAGTLVLWLGPAALLLSALGAAVLFYRRRAGTAVTADSAPPPLTAEESRRVAALFEDDKQS